MMLVQPLACRRDGEPRAAARRAPVFRWTASSIATLVAALALVFATAAQASPPPPGPRYGPPPSGAWRPPPPPHHGGWRVAPPPPRVGIYVGAGWGWPGWWGPGWWGPRWGVWGWPVWGWPPPVVVTQPPVVVQSSPPVFIERGDPPPREGAQQGGTLEPGYWYYCHDPAGYYPWVANCPSGWERVPPRPQDAQ